MMMPFNCSYRNKNEPTAIYPSLGYPVSNEASFFSILTNEACYYRRTIRPLGICATSEKQGGQHETGFRPVQAAASFFVTLTVDGQNRDLVNIWRNVDVEGGEYLTLHLEWSKQANTHYKLNHYYKGWIQKSMPYSKRKFNGHHPCFVLGTVVI
jgi:hypothetical protein